MRDLPALWRSRTWRAEAEAWIAAQVELTGPVEEAKVRFWAVVLRAPTAQGWVWFKENAPSQAFEAALVSHLSVTHLGVVPPVIAAEPERGWLLTRDLGEPVGATATLADWATLLREYGALQRALATDERAQALTPAFPEDSALTWLEREAGGMDLPPAGVALVAQAAERLRATDLSASLQHNDLHTHNALRGSRGRLSLIDFGDAVWANPVCGLTIPFWALRDRDEQGYAADGPELRSLAAAWLQGWGGELSVDDVIALMPAADRLRCLHRAECWRRLIADVPAEAVPEQWRGSVATWVRLATAPDPFEAWMAT